MTNPTVACVLRASKDFRPSAVVRLFEDVREHWTGALDFMCLTDTPIGLEGIREVPLANPSWPGYWSKLNLFDPAITGPLLYFDLDVMVVGSLADFQATRRLTTLRALKVRPGSRINSSIMALPEDARRPVWTAFQKNPARAMGTFIKESRNLYGFGDQGLLEYTWAMERRRVKVWQRTCPGQVESYKHTVRKRDEVGANTRIVYFHGKPRPWDIGWKLPPRRAT